MDIEVKLVAEQLGKDLERAGPAVQHEIEQAVENLANAAYSAIVAKIQGMSLNPKNRQDYLRGLKFQDLGDATWLIHLEGDWANKLEEGFGSYSIRDVLLKSTKTVEVGSRAGQPWVRRNAQGKKYAIVPMDHKPFSGEKTSGSLGDDIKKMFGRNRAGELQPITKIFNDLGGKPISGKVVAESYGPVQKNLQGLTKYQYVHESGKVSSIYLTFRAVSEDGKDWQHPGHKGYHLFKEAEQYVESELKNILQKLL